VFGRISQDGNREFCLGSGTIPEQGVVPEIVDGQGDGFIKRFGLHLVNVPAFPNL